jgi:putative transposase
MSERRFGPTPGGVSSLGLHLVGRPKCRRRILGRRVAQRPSGLRVRIAAEHAWQVVAKEVMPRHLHLVVRFGPTYVPAAVLSTFKVRTARVLHQELAHLGNHANVLWSPSYFAASVGYVSESTVRRYIGCQWDAVVVL